MAKGYQWFLSPKINMRDHPEPQVRYSLISNLLICSARQGTVDERKLRVPNPSVFHGSRVRLGWTLV